MNRCGSYVHFLQMGSMSRLPPVVSTAPGGKFQINVENLIDRSYVGLAFNDKNLTPAIPRTVRATLHFGI